VVERGVLQGLAIFRWAAWAWTAAALALQAGDLERPALGIALVGAAGVLTVALTAVWQTRPLALLGRVPVAAELVIGTALIVCDGLVREPGAVFRTGQSLGSVFPLAGILTAGVAFGPALGAITGVMGVGRLGAAWLNDVRAFDVPRVLSISYGVVFYAMAGAVSGYIFVRLRRAENEVAAARAREDVARRLHDGVLQTLALVERRATDPALARLAREQERELREYLFGQPAPATDLGAALRRAAARFEGAFGGRVDVVGTAGGHGLGAATIDAVAAAVGEALNNAGKHGRARRVVVYAEVDDDAGELFCSVKDDGAGAEPSAIVEGVGIGRSIRGRVAELGGRVELGGGAGQGMEVRLWLPVR
jgi:signal transduction histidine kinase